MKQTIQKTIESINQKPIHTRKQAGIFIISCLTILILIIWLSTLSVGKSRVVEEKVESPDSPFIVLKDNMVTLYASAKDAFKEASE